MYRKPKPKVTRNYGPDASLLCHGRKEEVAMITLKGSRIVDQWSTLMDSCQGEAEGMLQAIEANPQKHNAPT
jgi:hypothetical protein